MIEHVSMPHAALWVVQPWIKESPICEYLFQCRTRLCGWCNDVSSIEWIYQSKFQCRTRLCGWCNVRQFYVRDNSCTFQCRTRLCGWCNKACLGDGACLLLFQCRTRLCGWCNFSRQRYDAPSSPVSMPHAALWVVQRTGIQGLYGHWEFQCRTRLCGWCNRSRISLEEISIVSMPHAALWVVQPHWRAP